MPTNPNMVAIQTVTVGAGGAAQIDFTNIPQTYTDLKIVASIRLNTAGVQPDGLGFRFNSDSGANYSQRQLYGTGSTAGSSQNTGLTFGYGGPLTGTGATASTFGSAELYIPNYTASVNKSVSVDRVTENNGTAADAGFNANLWSNTAAITSIRLFDFNGNNFLQYSTATLYGVTSAQGLATGGFVTSDANYYYHTFTSSGTFTPRQSLSCDVLVIAGGGGGGYETAGGGGAGGVAYYSGQSLTAQGYTVTVGGGGNGGTSGNGTSGSNSVFGSLTAATGGGGGGGSTTGLNGGSGGGGKRGLNAGGTGTSGQGNAGGTGGPASNTNQASGGGGGGAGAVGGNGATSSPYGAGNGGAGTNTYSSWATATSTGVSGFYAGGGGGGIYGDGSLGAPNYGAGAGGSGGGGRGGYTTNSSSVGDAGQPATANTGSGGGGGSLYNVGGATAGGNGGSGIVIVRYAK